MHPLMENQKLVLRAQIANTQPRKQIEEPLALNPSTAEQSVKLKVDLPAPYAPLTVIHYLAQAQLQQEVSNAESGAGQPAIELSIEGPTQSFRRWLVAGDPERDRLSSYIGTWRFMAVGSQSDADALRKEFDTEFTRPPVIVVSAPGATAHPPSRFAVQEGATFSVDALQCKVTVQKYFSDYAMDREKLRAVNQSARRHNPAVIIEIEKNGVKENRTVFAKFPGFSIAGTESLPIDVQLDCPVEPSGDVPDFALLHVADAGVRLMTRVDNGSTVRSLDENEFVSISGSPYRFRITRFVPSAKLVETYRRDVQGKPAIEIEFAGKGGSTSSEWLEFGHTRTLETSAGPVVVSFEARDETPSQQGRHP